MRPLPCFSNVGLGHGLTDATFWVPLALTVCLSVSDCLPVLLQMAPGGAGGAQLMKCLACEHESLFDPLNPHSEKSWLWQRVLVQQQEGRGRQGPVLGELQARDRQ